MPAAPANVKDLSALVVRSKLLSADDLTAALRALKASGTDATDIDAARRLLVAGKHLTEYQAALLLRGHSEGFFLGPYKILELIAKGRMAGVYKAVHETGQMVAIKVLPASKARDPEILARFKREGRLLTQLDHPNIVRAFQVGEADGRHYLVLEYLDGETLEDTLERRKKLPVAEAIRIIHQTMAGLQHLHERKMIHRDLKPANLMLVGPPAKKGEESPDRTIKILDIGLGKAVFEEASAAPIEPNKITADGTLIGTPDYLAPEQARSAKNVDIRADIYTLGCVLFHALTGQPPFPDKSVLNQVMRHANEPPRPLSDFFSEVPGGLQDVMNKLMAKDPAKRYATPHQAAQALSAFLRNTPATRPAPAPLPAFEQWLQAPDPHDAAKNAAGIPVGKLEPSARPPEPRKATPPPEPAAAPDFDVELIPTPGPKRDRDDERRRGLLELSRRDLLMLCTGGALLAAALAAGWGLSRALRREPTPEHTPPPPSDNPPPEG
jgi:eukaryotic-like serine/threonine-protein kinase